MTLTTALLAACGGSDAPEGPPTAGTVTQPAAESSATATSSATGSMTSPTSPGAGPAASSPRESAGRGSSTAPASFEADPAVKALRLYYLGGAKAVNARSMNVPELRQSSTKAWLARVPAFFTPEFGFRYPGPIPFAPLAVTQTAPGRKQVVLCVLGDGWLQDPRTGRPTAPRALTRGVATVVRQGSAWRINDIVATGGSCAGASMQEELF